MSRVSRRAESRCSKPCARAGVAEVIQEAVPAEVMK
jgi:hypothetical protein